MMKNRSNASEKKHLAVSAQPLPTDNLPSEVNWVTAGAVGPVKNQNGCGACWSFTATGAVEGAVFLATGVLSNFSEQNLIDCADGGYGCSGCNGGDQVGAF